MPVQTGWKKITFEDTACALLVAAIAVCFFLLAGGVKFTREPEGYYNLQTAGFLQGHLYAAVKPPPELLALPDPYDPVANAPYRMHDMTFWKGKYYLYFGVAPVLVVFLPVRLVSGVFVTEPTVVALFVSLGLAFSARLLIDIRRRLFPRTSPILALLLVAAMGLASPTLLLNVQPQFYQVPIACAYALGMAGLWCVGRLVAAAPGRRERWLVAAGACFGLTLAARPNFILSMAALLPVVWWCLRDFGGWKAARPVLLRTMLCAFGPVAAVGVGLLIYNWARFGNPTEFGMRYQLAGQSFVNFTPLHVKYLLPHAGEYLWARGWWQSYFPFFQTGGPVSPYGLMRYLPLVWLGCLAAWPRRLPAETDAQTRWVLAGVIALMATANLLTNSLFFFTPVARYLCDFAPAWLLLGAIGALAAAQQARWSGGVTAAIALWSMGVTGAVLVQLLPADSYPTNLARLANRGAALWERAQGRKPGGIRLAIELPHGPRRKVEPIFQTGFRPDQRDWLQLHYLDAGQARFGFFHAGSGEILGEKFTLPPDGKLVLDVEAGAFLPPASHPLFDGWSETEIAAIRRKVSVKLGGQTVLAAALPCYPSRHGDLQLGSVGFPGDPARQVSAAKITLLEELAVQREPVPAPARRGVTTPLRIRLQFPADLDHGYEPLVCTGEAGRGELLYVIYHPGHRLQLGLDSWGRGVVFSRIVPFDPAKRHEFTVWMGAWTTSTDTAATASSSASRRFFVKMDETVLFSSERDFYPGADAPTGIGWNRIGAGSATTRFSGRLLEVTPLAASAVPDYEPGGTYGAVDMQIDLPVGAAGRTEPLIVTGRAGAGDILFIRYVNERGVLFGHDHWGKGGAVSRVLTVPRGASLHIEVSLGSLYADQNGPWGRRLWLRVNGRVVFDEPAEFYPASPGEISIGSNPIGGSTCAAEFAGKILALERPPEPKQP
jgi:hypothetical protein